MSARSVRTNEVQRLVAMIQHVLATKGARVTESAAASDSVSDDREIDVLVDIAGVPFHLKIAVEAKDHGRPMYIGQFEELLGKYFTDGGIPVDHLVVVTHRGFARKVIARARAENAYGNKITLQRLDELDAGAISQWSPATCQMFVAQEPPEIHIQTVEPLPTGLTFQELILNGTMSCPAGCHTSDLRSYLEGYFHESVGKANSARIKHMRKQSEALRRPVTEYWVAPGLRINWTCGSLTGQIDSIHFLIRCFSRVSFFHSRDWQLKTVLDDSAQQFRSAEVSFGKESIRMAMERTDSFPDSVVIQCVHNPKANSPHLMSSNGRVTFCGIEDEPPKADATKTKKKQAQKKRKR